MPNQFVSSVPRVTIARHETFHLRDGWVAKALHGLAADRASLSGPESHHDLGVGKNMLTSIRYWICAAGLASPAASQRGQATEYHLTELGRFLLDHDPYFEDERSLWIWHLEVATNREWATFWYWLFNEFAGFEFGESDAVDGFIQYVAQLGHEPPNRHSVKKDYNCLLRTYLADRGAMSSEETASPIVSLELLQHRSSRDRHSFNLERDRTIDPILVAYCTYRFMEAQRSGTNTVSIDELRWAPRSPGRLMCLDTRALVGALEAVHQTEGWFELTHTAGLRTVQLRQLGSAQVLTRLYPA